MGYLFSLLFDHWIWSDVFSWSQIGLLFPFLLKKIYKYVLVLLVPLVPWNLLVALCLSQFFGISHVYHWERLFCSLYDQIFKPSKLPNNADFHLFKAGVEPKWEDPECANGGKWTVTSSRKANLDTMWLETVNYELSS